MRRRGVAARILTTAGLAGVALLGLAAPAAAASSTESVTINGSEQTSISSDQTVSLAATASATCHLGLTPRTVSLSITGPTGPSPNTQTLTKTTKPCNQDVTLSASLTAPNRNGEYTVTVRNGSDTRTASATLDVLIPPSRPTGFGASATGTIATFTWNANSEPDIASYQVTRSSGAVATTVSASDACHGGSSCSASVDFGHSVAGQSETFAVRALRCGLSCSGDDVAGPESASTRVTFGGGSSSGPNPTPTPTPRSGGGGGGGGGSGQQGGHGGSGTHGGSGQHAGSPGGTAAGSSGRHHAGASAKPTPSHHARSKKASPSATATPGGATARPTASRSPRPSTVGAASGGGPGSAGSALWRSLAAAAVLVLLAAHLRVWNTRARLSGRFTGSTPTASPAAR